ncbi:uncharacterized protein LOC116167843 isoform X2 [Photinus pyralis]|uniref:uncharacterized protein LOC116167772 isoform X2 n=1 Tax=Photinus pyralis TaxID=7054 RepID=UPI0012675964|nr:uncharacterized protein LOC116167772 isoform X2 [Photinus pyralis]XP_031339269.1 uncharacterized protein LOC116167843 isoform X2 [Photinus pyralis]
MKKWKRQIERFENGKSLSHPLKKMKQILQCSQSAPTPPSASRCAPSRSRSSTPACSRSSTPPSSISSTLIHSTQSRSSPFAQSRVPLRCTASQEMEDISEQLSHETLRSQNIHSFADDEFKTKVLSELSFIKLKLSKIQKFMVIQKQNTTENDSNENNEVDLDVNNFPLSTDEDLNKIEEKLDNEEYNKKLIEYLGRIGGYT